MPAPSKSWTNITDGQVDADSPLDTTLITAIRDNLVHLEEWLGTSFTAAQDHDHDGANSKPVVKPADFKAGEELVVSADTERTQLGDIPGTWVKKKEVKIGRGGTLRVKFDAYVQIVSGAPTLKAARVYRNGSPVGTQRDLTTGYVTYSEDISGWSASDLVQIYIACNGTDDTIYVRNFRVYAQNNLEHAVNLD